MKINFPDQKLIIKIRISSNVYFFSSFHFRLYQFFIFKYLLLFLFAVICESNESPIGSHYKSSSWATSHQPQSAASSHSFRSPAKFSRHKKAPNSREEISKNAWSRQIRRVPHLSFVFINVSHHFASFHPPKKNITRLATKTHNAIRKRKLKFFPTEIIITTANAFTQNEIYVQSLSGGQRWLCPGQFLKSYCFAGALDQKKKKSQINLSFKFQFLLWSSRFLFLMILFT